MAARVEFCSATAADAPGCARRHSSRYCVGVSSRPASSLSSSWKSRSSQTNLGKKAASSAAPGKGYGEGKGWGYGLELVFGS